MNAAQLTEYLHDHIPLSLAMGVGVVSIAEDRVVLSAPLTPNLNHQLTAFGGSISALAILACWSYVRIRLNEAGIQATLVIQSNVVDYVNPATEAFWAETTPLNGGDIERFIETFRARERARLTVRAGVFTEAGICAKFEGQFVALAIRRQD